MKSFLALNAGLVAAVSEGSAINKVVTVLEDMKTTLEEETATAEKAHEKFECWCKKIDAVQEQIDEAKGKIDSCTAKIEEFTAKAATAETELEHLHTALDDANKEVETNKAVRAKEAESFKEMEVELTSGVTALGNALTVLSKHNSLAEAKSILKTIPSKSPALLKLLQQKENAPGLTTDAYENQTGGVFGVLKQMEEEFTNNLKQAQDEEASAQEAHNEWMAGKQEEIATTQESVTMTEESLAKSKETVARNEKELQAAQNLLGANTQALVDGQRACKDERAVFDEERKARAEENTALAEALKVLTSDGMFAAKTDVGAFLQTRHKSVSKRRVAAIRQLRAAGTPKAFLLSTKVGEDVFSEIVELANEMVDTIKENKQANQEAKDNCVAQLQESAARIQETEQSISKSEADQAQQETDIEQLTKNIETTEAEEKEMITTLNDKTEGRTGENKEFQTFVSEQQNFAKLINQAKAKLEKYYAKKKAALLQQSPADQAALGVAGDVGPMPEQKRYKAKDGNTVIQMLDQFVADAKTAVDVGTQEESASQAAYEEWVKGANNAITGFKQSVATSQTERAGVKAAHQETTKNLEVFQKTATEFAAADQERKDSCAFIMENFDANQAKCQNEIDAISDALASLKGMRPGENFLQKAK